MNKYQETREILELRKKIETDPILTDEEIEFIWCAMDRLMSLRPIKGSINPDKTQQYSCPNCGSQRIKDFNDFVNEKYCSNCGQKIDWSEE